MCDEQIAAGLQIAKAISTIGNAGANDIWCDVFQVPQGFYAEVLAVSVRGLGSGTTPAPVLFLCDPSYSFGASPLNSTGLGLLDTTKVGVALTASNQAFPATINVMSTLLGSGVASGVGGMNRLVMAPGWFLRCSTENGITGGEVTGAQFEVQVLFSLIPLCNSIVGGAPPVVPGTSATPAAGSGGPYAGF
jgi:hypothetical protein